MVALAFVGGFAFFTGLFSFRIVRLLHAHIGGMFRYAGIEGRTEETQQGKDCDFADWVFHIYSFSSSDMLLDDVKRFWIIFLDSADRLASRVRP